MHWKGVTHCDMKAANVLVVRDRHGDFFCALTDFGIAQMCSKNAHLVQAFKVVNVRGTLIAYAVPEVVTGLREGGAATKKLAFAICSQLRYDHVYAIQYARRMVNVQKRFAFTFLHLSLASAYLKHWPLFVGKLQMNSIHRF